MRLFLALHLPPPVADHLDDALQPVRQAHPGLRWVAASKWHLTLVFFGEVLDAELSRVQRQAARRVAGRSPLSLQVEGGGRFGHTVLWAGVGGDGPALRALARRLDPGGRPYRPHVTLARTREREDLRPVVDRLRQYRGPEWEARSVHLVRSYLGPDGRYEDLDSWPLDGPRSDPPGGPAAAESAGPAS